MKNLSLLALVAILFSSCGMFQDGFSNNGIQKRKYTSGFYIKNRGGLKAGKSLSNQEMVQSESVEEEAQVLSAVENNNEAKKEDVIRDGDQQGINAGSGQQENNRQETKKKAPVKKNNVPVPVKKRREHVPEKYMPIHKSEAIENKGNQKHSQQRGDDMFILAVILAILIPPLGVAVYTNIDWAKVLICLLLCFLFVLPGMIYALLVVFDVI